MDMSKLAIVAAMEREVAPLIRSWNVRRIKHGGRHYRLFESHAGEYGGTVLICGGIGAEAARRATEAVIQQSHPDRVLSVGFAGALDATTKIADVLEPHTVINAADGARIQTVTVLEPMESGQMASGKETLVSYAAVSDRDQKQRLAKSYGAVAVDMEAASVAQGAQARGIEFAALKAISDAADFDMPPVERFVSGDGQFHSARFALHVAMRPWLWGRTVALARNSARASKSLCAAIESYIRRESFAADLNQNTFSPDLAGRA